MSNLKLNREQNLSQKEISKFVAEAIRVNHAGEYGAVMIYSGQIKAMNLKYKNQKSEEKSEIINMYQQEIEHLNYFDKQILSKKSSPTIFHPIWKNLSYGLGFFSAIVFGVKGAMICTEAVEEVVDKHYQDQIDTLDDIIQQFNKKKNEDIDYEFKEKIELNSINENLQEKELNTDINNREYLELLRENIIKFKTDEVNHKNLASQYMTNISLPLKMLKFGIKSITKAAIFITKIK